MSAVLRSNANPSLCGYLLMAGREWCALNWANLEYCVRTGKQAPDHLYGAHIFEYVRQHPEEGQIFNDAMSGLSMIDSPAVAEAYDFKCLRSVY